MDRRKTTWWVALGLVCVPVLVVFFNIGRGSGESGAGTETEQPHKKLTALGGDQPNPASLFLAATDPDFTVRAANAERLREELLEIATARVFTFDTDAILLAAELGEDEIGAAIEAASKLEDPGRYNLLVALLARWAEFDPEKAADFTIANLGEHQVTGGLEAVFQKWGASAPEEALRWYQALEGSGRYEPRVGLPRTLSHLFFAWAKDNPDEAAAAAVGTSEDGFGFYAWVGIAGLAGIEQYRQGAIDAAVAVEDEKIRTKALSRVIGEWAWSDPGGAAGWLDTNGYPGKDLEWSVSERWSRLDPRASASWIYGRSNEETREASMARALNGWSRSDIEAAAAWLDEVGPTEGSIAIIAQGYSSVDLDKAIEWANRAAVDKRDEVIVGALAEARMRDQEVDLTPYLESGSLTAEEMEKKVEDRYQMLQRF